MATYQSNFKRYEKKYLLDKEQYSALREHWFKRMKQDYYGSYTIGNIYLDTDNYQLIQASIEKPVYKEKIRLRSYGIPKGDDRVYLELKKKFKGIVYKRRVALTLEEANGYFLTHQQLEPNCQVTNEINWFLESYQPVPKVLIAYDRTALHDSEDPDLRITFDENIRWRTSELDLSQGNWGRLLLDVDQILMEIKFPNTMPLWLSNSLSQLEIFPTSFSKYGVCYQKHLHPNINDRGGNICA